ncbi:MAG: metal-dependent hydrolase [Pseudomonadota bacterium]
MKSPTHFLVGYDMARLLGWQGSRHRWLVAGALAPDCPVVCAGLTALATTLFDGGTFDFVAFKERMDCLYFLGWLTMSAHNLLHSPLSLALLAALAVLFVNAERRSPFLAFLAGAAGHAVLDIFTHVEDGPLLLWPLDWETRVVGPVSHWDARFGGLVVTAVELTLWMGTLIVVSTRPWPGMRVTGRTAARG